MAIPVNQQGKRKIEPVMSGGGGALSGSGGGSLTIKEIDGVPTVSNVNTIQVTNATLTDNGGGNVTLSIGGAALNDPGSNGIVVRTALNITIARALIQPTAGFTITNSDGVSGNPTFVLANDLAALESLSTTGFAVRSAADTWLNRSIIGTANKIVVTNSDGVGGNPTLNVGSSVILITSSLADLATRSAGDLNSGTLLDARLSTNVPLKNTVNVHTKAVVITPIVLTDAATIATDANTSNRFRVTLGGNRTLGNPTNTTDGQQCVWEIIQDGTGGRALALDTAFVLCTGILLSAINTAANKRSFLTAIFSSTPTKWYVVGITAEP